jgi:DNA-binding transcriptional LysR family regulator
MDMLHEVKVSRFDFNRAKSLYFLLEEGHVGRAAAQLGITPAAASNALRRLREEFDDPILVKKGRGLMRTRLGEELRAAAREVVLSTERLIRAARPFEPSTYRGEVPIAMAEHVADFLLPEIDQLLRNLSPNAILAVAAIPLDVSEWLERTRGVLVGPTGTFAAAGSDDALLPEVFYEDRYVCVMRHDHPLSSQRWTADAYAEQQHVLVTPRARSQHSDVDEQLKANGLSRRVVRVVPSFTLALSLVARSDLITTIPKRCTGRISPHEFIIKDFPLALRPLVMNIIIHPAHSSDARIGFIKDVLRTALLTVDRGRSIGAPRPRRTRTARPSREV